MLQDADLVVYFLRFKGLQNSVLKCVVLSIIINNLFNLCFKLMRLLALSCALAMDNSLIFLNLYKLKLKSHDYYSQNFHCFNHF